MKLLTKSLSLLFAVVGAISANGTSRRNHLAQEALSGMENGVVDEKALDSETLANVKICTLDGDESNRPDNIWYQRS